MLKEFDLDAPKEAKDSRHQFGLETRCVTALFERNFIASKETGKIWKILVEAVPLVTKQDVRDLLGVLTLECAFDVAAFFKLKPIEKKAAALTLLENGIKRISKIKGWDMKPFLEAAYAVRESGYINEWIWKKPFKKLGASIYAEVFCRHDIDAFTIHLRISNEVLNQNFSFPITRVQPTEFVFIEYLGKAEWHSNQFKLFSKSGTLVGEVAIDNDGKPELIFPK